MPPFSFSELKDFLDTKYLLYNHESFIADDPISIPRIFSLKQDIEIAGFLAASISWGQRPVILRNCMSLLERMGMSPFDFVLNFKANDLKPFDNFAHRTFNGTDCKYFLLSLQHIYRHKGGLNHIFFDSLNVHNFDIANTISMFRQQFFELPYPTRTIKHVADPLSNSAAKRICMYLRWMVRKDENGVDFGIWSNIAPSVLAIPLDVHSARVARSLRLLQRKQNDWKSVIELTNKLREFDPNDPVKYDFALFGLGINEKFQ